MSTLRFENLSFGAWDCLVSWQQKPTSSVVQQLRLSMSSGNSIVQNMAVKAVFDQGATSLDRAVGIDPDLGLPAPCPLGSQVFVIVSLFLPTSAGLYFSNVLFVCPIS